MGMTSNYQDHIRLLIPTYDKLGLVATINDKSIKLYFTNYFTVVIIIYDYPT